jgi:hypothetical protein
MPGLPTYWFVEERAPPVSVKSPVPAAAVLARMSVPAERVVPPW